MTNNELAGKEPLVSLAANRVVSTTSSGHLEVSNVSNTEFGSLSGLPSSVQSQLGAKEPAYTAISPLVKGFSLASNDGTSDLVSDAFQSGKFRIHAISDTSFQVQGFVGAWQTIAQFR